MSGSDLILKPRPVTRIREVTKSFSYKLDMKRYDPWYENRDFFCSAKADCDPDEPGDAERVADDIYKFCRASVVRDVKEYLGGVLAEQQRRKGAA